MRVAFVHEFLTQYGGAERVLEALLDLWPDAPIYTSYYDEAKMGQYFGQYTIRPSFLQKLPAPKPAGYKWFLPLMPKAFESFDFSDYDVVISNASAFSKGIRTKSPTVHLCYLLTPTRYLWSDRTTYLAEAPVPGFVRPIMPPVLHWLKKWDYRAAQRPDILIADSETTAERSRRYYDRNPDGVIFPPVNAARFHVTKKPGTYWLVVARQEPYKRTDLALSAATKLGLPLKVVGGGTKLGKLRELAGPTVEFVGRVPDAELAELYANAIGLIFPQLEDAGITPLEAMASGRPVIAFGQGGALETVVPGVTGEFFQEQTVDSLVACLENFRAERYDANRIRTHAESFDVPQFQEKLQGYLAIARHTS